MTSFDEWYSWCSFNSGDIKHACREAYTAGQKSVLDRMPSEDEIVKFAKESNIFVQLQLPPDYYARRGAFWLRDKLTQGETVT